ncbi:MAG: recombinase family protein [Alphaproteobacteria bacterium]|nr:recombinase family protein [Alphaproteobacteria bacterium]QQS56474.1 MAG: recombinase family protein [Alphaproteobacteria bacterium]
MKTLSNNSPGKRVALYARYSSDLQSDHSIEDQVRLCTERAKAEGWTIVEHYSDAGLSGASLMRPGIQALIRDALAGQFDIVLAEALDRLSRDQEDIAGIYKRLQFAGVAMWTLSEGEISTLHIGLKGTMNAMFLKDLADKTRRGLRGRIEHGKSGGGIAYGYDVVKRFDAQGQALRGDRTVNAAQAAIVVRIFEDYARKNLSPKAIAAQFNREGIKCPSGKAWGQSTINGNRRRGTGILNNELYIGQLVWNRQRFIKDPATGRRVTRLNDEASLIRQSIPELRIVPQELWDAAKARQKDLDAKAPGLWARNRPRYLLSGLVKCGVCGGGYAKINATHYGCASSKNKGESVCGNRKTMAREHLEGKVLSALQTHLMRDDLLAVFCAEYTAHLNRLRAAQDDALREARAEREKLQKARANVLQAIREGIAAALVKDELESIAARLEVLDKTLAQGSEQARPLLHPTMARRYREEVAGLREALATGGSGGAPGEASEHVRGLIEKIVLTPWSHLGVPGRDELKIDLYGDLAGILDLAAGAEAASKDRLLSGRTRQAVNDNRFGTAKTALVAGALNQRYLPLFQAFDIAAGPAALDCLSALLSEPEGVRAARAAHCTGSDGEPATAIISGKGGGHG